MPEIMAEQSTIPPSSVLTNKVHRILGLNPSWFTGPGTNTYLVGMDGNAPLLIDSGSGVPAWLHNVTQHLNTHGKPPLAQFIATHGHADHIGGVEQLLGIFSEMTCQKHPWPGRDETLFNHLSSAEGSQHSWKPLFDGEVIEGPGYTLHAVHCPGHAPDHLCYYFEEEKALFSGDVILGVGTTVIPKEGGDLCQYLDSLRRLLKMDIERIYPGHGPVITEAKEKIQSYLEHRLAREKQIVDLLTESPHTLTQIVKTIYKDYPEALHAAAAQSIGAHLDKLVGESKVRPIAPDDLANSPFEWITSN